MGLCIDYFETVNNRWHGEVGHLFQGRYKAILCDKDAYLLELVRYIHLNPVRAKVVKTPEDYEWTGHMSYLRKGADSLIDEELVLDQFGDRGSLGRRRYRRFVWEGISGGHEEKYYRVKDQRYLGEDSFIERVEKERKEPQSWVYEVPIEAISGEWGQIFILDFGSWSKLVRSDLHSKE